MDIYSTYIAKSRYARFDYEKGRREHWDETVARYVNFMEKQVKKHDYTLLAVEKDMLTNAITNLEVVPSMRCLMTAGAALEISNVAGFNCSFCAMDNIRCFDEIMYILLCGTGVGFSAETKYTNKLPTVSETFHDTDTTIVVGDSKIGWASSFRELISLLYAGKIPKWDTSKVRPAGAPLKTFGGRASGPEPLIKLFKFAINMFKKAAGRKLTDLEVHDLVCTIAEIVVVGGVRRSALISLGDLSSDRMRTAKSGQWWNENVQRALANNSAVYTEKPEIGTFMKEWISLYESKSGERGIFNREASEKHIKNLGRREPGHDWGTNPCCVVGETQILTSTGYQQIKDTVGKKIQVWNGFEFSEVEPFTVGVHPTLKITLSNGAVIESTHNHKFMISNSYGQKTPTEVFASSLKIGDKLFKYEMPSISGDDDPEVDAYSQGFYSGDGNTNYKFSYVYTPKYVCENRLVGTISSHSDDYNRKRWVHGQMMDKNFVPINASMNYKLNWLAGILDSDGCVVAHKDGIGNGFQIGSVTPTFLNDIRLMLTTMGIQSKVIDGSDRGEANMPDGRGGMKMYPTQKSYRLLIGNMQVYELGKLGLKTNRLEWHSLQPQRDASHFVKVVSIDQGQTAECFCFNEPKNHTGTFNGVVTGQSEIILRPNQFCNLSEVIIREEDTEEILIEKVKIATIFGTLQSTLTDFKYLRSIWKRNTEEERLLGVSLTGIMDNPLTSHPTPEFLTKLRDVAVETNKEWAAKLGINCSVAITCVKPSGCTTSETKIKTTDGIKSIGEIFEMAGYSIEQINSAPDHTWLDVKNNLPMVYDENNNLQEITKLYVNCESPVVQIEFEDGKIYSFTPNHKLLTKDGWKRADQLAADDEIVSF